MAMLREERHKKNANSTAALLAKLSGRSRNPARSTPNSTHTPFPFTVYLPNTKGETVQHTSPFSLWGLKGSFQRRRLCSSQQNRQPPPTA